MESYTLYLSDCLEIMPGIPSESVDAIIADWPFGTTACPWDSIIPLEPLWKECKRVIKKNGAIVLTAGIPFNYTLWASNSTWFKYDWIWDKKIPAGMSYARFQPMRQHEYILVFCEGSTVYNRQMTQRAKPIQEGGKKPSLTAPIANFKNMGGKVYTQKNPVTIVQFDKIRKGSLHPCEKPVALMEYLIKTYTNPGDLVLDNTMGSGSTGEACLRTGRRFIGIEKDPGYFEIAKSRLEKVERELKQQPYLMAEAVL